jgi:hypothetical protein
MKRIIFLIILFIAMFTACQEERPEPSLLSEQNQADPTNYYNPFGSVPTSSYLDSIKHANANSTTWGTLIFTTDHDAPGN